MQEAVRTPRPAHILIVGLVATLWNAFGAYDYLMTRTRNMEYLSSIPGVDATTMLAYIDSYPLWAQVGWGLGVWSGLIGSLLLIARSRFAVHAFAASLVGIALSFGYMFLGPPPPAAMSEGAMAMMPIFIFLVGVALLAYAMAMRKKGALG